jgi:hypothetical protein
MKLTVEVFGLDDEGQKKRGEIIWDGEKMTSSNDSQLLKTIVEEPIGVKGKALFAKDDPELFMRSLCVAYSGSYVRCSKAS